MTLDCIPFNLDPNFSISHHFSLFSSCHPLASSDTLPCTGDPACVPVMMPALHAWTSGGRWIVAVPLGCCCLVVKDLNRCPKGCRFQPYKRWPITIVSSIPKERPLNDSFVNGRALQILRAWQIRRLRAVSWGWSGFMDTEDISAGITCTTPRGRRSCISWLESEWFSTPESTHRSFTWDTTTTSLGMRMLFITVCIMTISKTYN